MNRWDINRIPVNGWLYMSKSDVHPPVGWEELAEKSYYYRRLKKIRWETKANLESFRFEDKDGNLIGVMMIYDWPIMLPDRSFKWMCRVYPIANEWVDWKLLPMLMMGEYLSCEHRSEKIKWAMVCPAKRDHVLIALLNEFRWKKRKTRTQLVNGGKLAHTKVRLAKHEETIYWVKRIWKKPDLKKKVEPCLIQN